jgi:hypothetical protein
MKRRLNGEVALRLCPFVSVVHLRNNTNGFRLILYLGVYAES